MPNSRNYSNLAVSTTLGATITNIGTSLWLASQTGMPAQPFLLSIDPDTANEELVLVTAGSGTVGSPYTVTRGIDGTAAVAHNSAVVVQHRVAAMDHTDSRTHEATAGGIHGLNGSVMTVNGGNAGLTSNIVLTNTVTETTVSKQFTVTGNTLVAGSCYRIWLFGTIATTNATPNIVWKWKYGSNVLATFTTTATTTTIATTDFRIMAEFVAQSVGASGSVSGAMTLWAPTFNTVFTVANANPTDTAGLLTSISTTGSNALVVTAQWSAANASNILTTIGSNVEQLF